MPPWRLFRRGNKWRRPSGPRSGHCKTLVAALSRPVADLHLSNRSASALQTLHIRYGHELVQQSPTDLFTLPNFENKSPTEGKEKLATLGLTLAMTLEEDSYRAAIVAAVAATIVAVKGGAA
jgi:DNA-directed RNA polymerase alpha subunit